MVGRETCSTYTNGRPAMMSSCFVVVVEYSGPATGCASGAAPGHIGTCMCPGSGRQTVFCPFRHATERTKQRAKIHLIRISRTQAYNSESLPRLLRGASATWRLARRIPGLWLKHGEEDIPQTRDGVKIMSYNAEP